MIEPLTRARPPLLVSLAKGPQGLPAVYVYRDVLEEIRFNGSWNPKQMAGGLLVGSHFLCPDSGEPFVEVEGFVAGTHAEDVTGFTRDLRIQWKPAVASLHHHFPAAELVGWYAAFPEGEPAPGQAALVLHNTFFPHGWQVGLWVGGGQASPRALLARGDALVERPVGIVGARPAPAAR